MPPADAKESVRAAYLAMQNLSDGMTAQSRGQRFNRWLADMLEAHGIEARANQRSAGEIDVAFGVGETRYILEAKWTRSKS